MAHIYPGPQALIRGRRIVRVSRVALAACASLLAAIASAEPRTVVNAIRSGGCAGRAPAAMPLAASAALDDVARDMSRKRALGRALERAGYRATSATSLHLRGASDDAAVRGLLIERSCDVISDVRYAEIGVFAAGEEIWIVLAAQQPPPPHLEPNTTARRVLDLVNAARAEPRACGRERFAAAPPLTLSPVLNEAARAHALDMAGRGSLDHRGSDGSFAGERITRAGYVWRASGENIAAGQRDEEAVVAAWIASPAHCASLMAPYFSETGIAFALVPERNPAIYWVQVFAAP